MKSVEQEENGADADHRAEDERVPSLPQVDSLDEVVDGWETVWESRKLRKTTKFSMPEFSTRLEIKEENSSIYSISSC